MLWTAPTVSAAAALVGCCLALLAASQPSAEALPAPAPSSDPVTAPLPPLVARPATPDDFLGLLLWAQAASERALAGAVEETEAEAEVPDPDISSARAHVQEEAHNLVEEWRAKHRGLYRKAAAAEGAVLPPKKAPPFTKKHLPPPKTTTTTTSSSTSTTSTAAPAPAPTHAPVLWAPEDAVARAAVPAHEEYDRSERFAHSFVHGFRPF